MIRRQKRTVAAFLVLAASAGIACAQLAPQQGVQRAQPAGGAAVAGRVELPLDARVAFLEGKVQALEAANAQHLQRLAQMDARFAQLESRLVGAEQQVRGAQDAANLVRSVIQTSGPNIAIRASGGLTLEAGGNLDIRGNGAVNLRGAAINLN